LIGCYISILLLHYHYLGVILVTETMMSATLHCQLHSFTQVIKRSCGETSCHSCPYTVTDCRLGLWELSGNVDQDVRHCPRAVGAYFREKPSNSASDDNMSLYWWILQFTNVPATVFIELGDLGQQNSSAPLTIGGKCHSADNMAPVFSSFKSLLHHLSKALCLWTRCANADLCTPPTRKNTNYPLQGIHLSHSIPHLQFQHYRKCLSVEVAHKRHIVSCH